MAAWQALSRLRTMASWCVESSRRDGVPAYSSATRRRHRSMIAACLRRTSSIGVERVSGFDWCAVLKKACVLRQDLHFEDANPLLASREEAYARRDDFLGVHELRLCIQDGELFRSMRQAFELCHRCEELVGRELPARWEEKSDVNVAARTSPASRHGSEQVNGVDVGHMAADVLHKRLSEPGVKTRSGLRQIRHDLILERLQTGLFGAAQRGRSAEPGLLPLLPDRLQLGDRLEVLPAPSGALQAGQGVKGHADRTSPGQPAAAPPRTP